MVVAGLLVSVLGQVQDRILEPRAETFFIEDTFYVVKTFCVYQIESANLNALHSPLSPNYL